MDFETNELRKLTIQMASLVDVDNHKTFYYDETNNIRSYNLKKGKFNESIQTNFILGGLVLDEGQEVDLSDLFDSFKLQSNIAEVKLTHLAQGSFINCLKSPHLGSIFDFLISNKVYIHYSSLNFLYFSVVDIIDSLCNATDIFYDAHFNRVLKNDLYLVIKRNIDTFRELFYKYKYPNLKEESVLDFITDLITIFEKEKSSQGIKTILMLLRKSKESNELLFLMNEEDHELIKDFGHFYSRTLYLFINSSHVFDEEYNIEQMINALSMTFNSKRIENFSFVNSLNSKFIQLCDIIVGLLGKYFKFVNDTSVDDMANILKELNHYQKRTLKLFDQLLYVSEMKNRAYIHLSVSNDEIYKINYLSKIIKSNF